MGMRLLNAIDPHARARRMDFAMQATLSACERGQLRRLYAATDWSGGLDIHRWSWIAAFRKGRAARIAMRKLHEVGHADRAVYLLIMLHDENTLRRKDGTTPLRRTAKPPSATYESRRLYGEREKRK